MERKEIEVKACVRDLATVFKKLSEHGCFLSDPIEQTDRVYIPHGASIPVPKGVNVLRIRKQNDKLLLTLKQPLTNQLDCIEKELSISDASIMEEIIILLGFELSSITKKRRRKCQYQGFEICVDEVENLGTYIEVEKLSDEDSEKVQEELFVFLESLGIKREDREKYGYDVLMKMKNEKK